MSGWTKAIFCSGALLGATARAQSPVGVETFELRQLVTQSKQQLDAIADLIKYAKKDSSSLERASKLLDSLSSGLNDSIKKYQGTRAYQEALLQVQAEELKERKKAQAARHGADAKAGETLNRFQEASLEANRDALKEQQKLETALEKAGPGFVPKLQAQAQLGTWQASTQVSSQLSQMLQSLEELRAEIRERDGTAQGLATLLEGSQKLIESQQENAFHGRP